MNEYFTETQSSAIKYSVIAVSGTICRDTDSHLSSSPHDDLSVYTHEHFKMSCSEEEVEEKEVKE